jgi:hypothetical protein
VRQHGNNLDTLKISMLHSRYEGNDVKLVHITVMTLASSIRIQFEINIQSARAFIGLNHNKRMSVAFSKAEIDTTPLYDPLQSFYEILGKGTGYRTIS